MFRNETVFIVGAGASIEAGLPDGNKLKEQIATKLNLRHDLGSLRRGDKSIADALVAHAHETGVYPLTIENYLRAAHHIAEAMPQAKSIDNFIDAHTGNLEIEIVGKLAIGKCIIEAERASRLYVDPRDTSRRLNFGNLSDTWYSKFFQILIENCRKDNIQNIFKNVSFITFNYDRCIEHFLFHALQNYYHIDWNVAANLVGDLRIFHPYGIVGKLPWQKAEKANAFGGGDLKPDFLELAGQIKTFGERMVDREEINRVHMLMRDAETIIFLGFAYHSQNMILIKPEESILPGERMKANKIFGTAYRMSESDIGVIREDLLMFPHQSDISDRIYLDNGLTCADLFSHFEKSL